MINYFLDDEIVIEFALNAHTDTKGTYEIYQYERWKADDAEGFGGQYTKLLFVGNIFISADDKSFSVYLNDIVESNKRIPKVLVPYLNAMPQTIYGYDDNIEDMYTAYYIKVMLDDGGVYEDIVSVYNAYRYPARISNCDMIGLPEVDDENADNVMILSEGYDSKTALFSLMPRIPFTYDNYFSFGAFILPTYKYLNEHEYEVYLEVRDWFYSYKKYTKVVKDYVPQYLTVTNPTLNLTPDDIVFKNTLMMGVGGKFGVTESIIKMDVLKKSVTQNQFIDWLMNTCGMTQEEADITYKDLSGGETVIVYTSADGETMQFNDIYEEALTLGNAWKDTQVVTVDSFIPFAHIDICPSRYYLVWHDRMGGLQCQPFKQQVIYSETMKNTYIQNQYNQKRLGVNELTPSWKLVSEWIKDEEYPLYESLFTSPYIDLVDTENKVVFPVLITDTNYTEKTYKNQGKNLNNFTLNVQLNKAQRITY